MNNKIPNHVAIIMDGNGRWATKRGMPRNIGHKKGAQRLLKVVEYALELNIKFLTVYAFSTENWKRPEAEVKYLMDLPFAFFGEIERKFKSKNIKVKVVGFRDGLPEKLIKKINEVEENTKNNDGMTFSIAFNYGSQDEIVDAVNYLVDNKININKSTFKNYFTSKDLPDVDLLIRTSGEQRISNFLLWQLAYSELHFTKTLWPDYSKKEFVSAIEDYSNRDRRYGGLK